MKMATSDGSPLRQGAGTGSRLVFGGYRGLRRRNSRSRFIFGGFCIYRNFQRRSHVRGGLQVIHEIGAHAQGGRARPPPSWMARDSSGPTLLLRGLLLVYKYHQKSARQLDSVWYSFSVKLKNKEKKQKLALGSRLIGQSQKSYKIAYKTSQMDNIIEWNNKKLQIRWRCIKHPQA